MTTAQLLRQAADALDNGEDPFGVNFLQEHNVSLDQCFSMAEQLAVGARMVAKAMDNPHSLLAQEYFIVLAGV
jgi:hypothetical protein